VEISPEPLFETLEVGMASLRHLGLSSPDVMLDHVVVEGILAADDTLRGLPGASHDGSGTLLAEVELYRTDLELPGGYTFLDRKVISLAMVPRIGTSLDLGPIAFLDSSGPC
jgi:hypothetical protein